MKQINDFPNPEDFENILNINHLYYFMKSESIIKYKDNFYIKRLYNNKFYYLHISLEDLERYLSEEVSYGELAEKYNKFYELSYNQLVFLTRCHFKHDIIYVPYILEIFSKYKNETNKR